VTSFDLVRANLRRNRLRTALTATSILLATLLVCFLLSLPAFLDQILSRAAGSTRISVVNRAGLVYFQPFSLLQRVRSLPGVAGAVGFVWFGGTFEEAGRVTFPSFAVEAEHIGSVYPDYEIPSDVLAAFVRYRDAALVGPATMKRYGWRPGDHVTLQSGVWNVSLELRIVGELPQADSPLVWIQREYLDQALQAVWGRRLGQVGVIWIRAESPDAVQPVMDAVDALTRTSDAPTTQQTEKDFFSSFLGSLRGFISVLLAVTALVTLCIVFIAANTASLAIRERAREIALLKALGFGRGRIFALLLGENLLLCSVSGALGVAIAAGISHALRGAAGSSAALGPLGGFKVTGTVIAAGLAIAVGVGIASGLVPAWGAARRRVAAALHEAF
jgi:putative ABC transport system permease protein